MSDRLPPGDHMLLSTEMIDFERENVRITDEAIEGLVGQRFRLVAPHREFDCKIVAAERKHGGAVEITFEVPRVVAGELGLANWSGHATGPQEGTDA